MLPRDFHDASCAARVIASPPFSILCSFLIVSRKIFLIASPTFSVDYRSIFLILISAPASFAFYDSCLTSPTGRKCILSRLSVAAHECNARHFFIRLTCTHNKGDKSGPSVGRSDPTDNPASTSSDCMRANIHNSHLKYAKSLVESARRRCFGKKRQKTEKMEEAMFFYEK